MKKIISIGLLTTVGLIASNLTEFKINNYGDIVIEKKLKEEKIINIAFLYSKKNASAVSYIIEKNKVNQKIKKRPRFYAEKSLQKKYRVKPAYYTNTGYDRGHLAPDADFDYNYKVLLKVYTMANIVPQTPSLNRKIWFKAEKLERILVNKFNKIAVLNLVKYNNDKILRIKSNIIKNANDKYKKKLKRYDKNLAKMRIAIPSDFYKIIKWSDNKEDRLCLHYVNKKYSVDEIKRDKLKQHIVDCELILN